MGIHSATTCLLVGSGAVVVLLILYYLWSLVHAKRIFSIAYAEQVEFERHHPIHYDWDQRVTAVYQRMEQRLYSLKAFRPKSLRKQIERKIQ